MPISHSFAHLILEILDLKICWVVNMDFDWITTSRYWTLKTSEKKRRNELKKHSTELLSSCIVSSYKETKKMLCVFMWTYKSIRLKWSYFFVAVNTPVNDDSLAFSMIIRCAELMQTHFIYDFVHKCFKHLCVCFKTNEKIGFKNPNEIYDGIYNLYMA